MKDRAQRWYRLDNQGRIFPEVYNKKEPHTFRIQIRLTEKIDPELLQKAVNNLLDRFPMFKVHLRRGLFWTYLEENDKPYFIQQMPYKICGYTDFRMNNDYLFRVFYRNKTIAVEIFHTVTDGTGLSEFVKSLTYEYLVLKGYKVTPDNLILTKKQKPVKDEEEDSSKTYYNQANSKRAKEKPAYRITGTTIPDNDINLISGILNTQQIKDLAKKNNATVTHYIVAAMVEAIYKTKIRYRRQIKENRNPVKIGLPVNLRTRFPSTTLRNFVNIIGVAVDLPNDDVTFEEILEVVKQEIAEKTTLDELTRIMSEYVSYEKNIFVRILPAIIKRYAMKIGYKMLGSSLFTMSLSNVGLVRFPESMEPFIEDMAFMVGAGRNNRINMGIITVKDRFKITFNSNILETTIQKEFFRHFTNLGLDVEIESNYMEENHERV